MTTSRWLGLVLAFALAAGSAPAQTLRVLVTNDDGVGAPGIDALVQALAANPNLDVTVVAPATNQSGTGDSVTNPPNTITSQASSTAGAFPATAVGGFPADTVLFGALQTLPSPPDLVVSGINHGQNIADAVGLSGTVGAALWAARLGIPAFAVSARLGTSDFSEGATFTAELVERFRTLKSFRKRMIEKDEPKAAIVLNLNFTNCPGGSRDMRLVSVGRASQYVGYTLQSDVGGVQTWVVDRLATNLNAVDCASTVEDVATDAQAFTNGFATLTPLSAEGEVSSSRMRQFRFVAKLFKKTF